MGVASAKSTFTLILSGLMLLLLALASHMIYRWIDRVSIADNQQQKQFLNTAMNGVDAEFTASVHEVLAAFRPVSRIRSDNRFETDLAGLYGQWQKGTTRPKLVDSVSIGTLTPSGIFRRRASAGSDFQAEAWPASLEVFRELLAKYSQIKEESPPFPPVGYALAFDGDNPMIVFPLMKVTVPRPKPPPPRFYPPKPRHEFDRGPPLEGFHRPPPGTFPRRPPIAGMDRRPSPPFQADQRRPPPVPAPRPRTQLVGLCFVRLDGRHLQQEALPKIAAGVFRGAGLTDYRLALLTEDPPRVIYQSDPAVAPEWFTGATDASIMVFKSEALQGFPSFKVEGSGLEKTSSNPDSGSPSPQGPDTWWLVARHRSGSIASVTTAARRHNLVLGFGVLALLAISVVVLALSAQRARLLAKRQMEFMAGVTHELGTPLAVIQSAGFNLAEGIIQDTQRVQQYGAMIQNEGRRLSDMVEQVLDYAGIESRANYELTPTRIPEVVERALAAYVDTFERGGWTVEKEVQDDLPLVLANARSLESAVKNLLQNAVKYGADGKWIRISAHTGRNGKSREVELTVADRGAGIDPGDLPHIFDPFYRGRKVLGSNIAGAGLGLSLLQRHVKAFRGRVSVKSAPGAGAEFTLHLPAITNSTNQAD